MSRVIINGRVITNPVTKFLIQLAALLIAAVVVTLVLTVVLPVVGVAVISVVGIALLAVIVVVLAIPIFAIGGPILAILLAPFVILFRGFFPRDRDDW